MKRIIVVFLCLISIQLFAQDFKGGILGGFVASQISGDGLSGFNKFSPQIGAFVNKKHNEALTFEMQLYYVQKGSRRAANLISGNLYTYRLRLNYIEIPFLLRYNYKNKFNVEIGLSEAVLFKYSVSNAFGNLPPNDPENRPFRKLETAFILGASYPINEKVIIYIRNSNSLLPVRKHISQSSFLLNFGQYNSVMLFGLQYTL